MSALPEPVRFPIIPVIPNWCSPVHGIEPRNGWQLCRYDEDDSDRFVTVGYVAVCGQETRLLSHPRFSFDPSQDWFDFVLPERLAKAEVVL
jgi:hypothetical protein